ncbi:SDR family oxidoreductase [Longivirga aurantiaca]|uniref:Peroxisomal trans-2-enoyl-CoA reductase n=1 Tax=Longivirga aurantiaca TaxID=1837743 RepID=A0ABW1T5U9_9ACTN
MTATKPSSSEETAATPVEPTSPQSLAVLADGSLSGRTALVTGGGSGIGRASALLMARLGARVLVVGRNAESLEETARRASVAGYTGAVSLMASDIREPENVDAVLDAVAADLGRLDILVNNAGGQFVSAAESLSYKGFRAVTRLNLDATWYLTVRAAERFMLPAGYGKVISIVMSPQRGIPGMAHSSAARSAIESLMRTLAVEWGPRGVRTVAIAPGFVHTEALTRYGVDIAGLARTAPLRRVESADEVAALIAFVASVAGDYITGTTLVADGGLNTAAPGAVD